MVLDTHLLPSLILSLEVGASQERAAGSNAEMASPRGIMSFWKIVQG